MSDPSDIDAIFGSASSAPPAQAPKARAGAEARRELRMRVKWAARALLADGRVVPMTVRDISEHGVGLISERPITQNASLRVAMAVPDINGAGRFTTVTGTVKTAHITISGPDLIYGGVWQSVDGNGTEIIQKWVRKLRP
jgi:hypothetical protein